eukprot:PRCOL_00006132-RA
MGDFNAVSEAFVNHYYNTFDTNRAGLASLYQDTSMLTFEGQQFQGATSIVEKLQSLAFDACKHTVTTRDAQPVMTGQTMSIIVFVSGTIALPNEERPLKFSQVFHLCQTAQQSWFVYNDMFRLNYA